MKSTRKTMPKLAYTGTPDKDETNLHQQLPPTTVVAASTTPPQQTTQLPPTTVVAESVRTPQQTTKKSSKPPRPQQQQQQQRKDATSNPKKKLYDCVEQAPSIQNDSTTTTAPLSGGDKSTMIESLLLSRSKELLLDNNADQSTKLAATSSSVETWSEDGIFANNTGDGAKSNGQGDSVAKDMKNGGGEAERAFINSVIELHQQQQQQQVVQEKTNDDGLNNTEKTEVIVIDDSSDEEPVTNLQQLYKGKEWDKKNGAWVSSAAAKETAKEPVQSAASAQEQPNNAENGRNNVATAAAAPIVHVSTSNKAKQTAENITEPKLQQLYEGKEWDNKSGGWVSSAAKESAKKAAQLAAQSAALAQEQEVPKEMTTVAEANEGKERDNVAAAAAAPIINVSTSNRAKQTAENSTKTNLQQLYEGKEWDEKSGSWVMPMKPQTFVDETGIQYLYTHTSTEEFQEMYQKQQQKLKQWNQAARVARLAAPIIQDVQQHLHQQQLLQLQQQQQLQQQLMQQQQRRQLLHQVAPRNATSEQNQHEKGVAPSNSRTNPPAPILQQQQQRQQQQQPRQPQLHRVAPRTATNEQNEHKNVGAPSNNRTTPPAHPMSTNTATANGSNSDKPPQSNSLPNLERFSEYQIDSAKSITELEAIRHRLLILTERTNSRLKEMRVHRALGNQVGVKGAEKLSTKQLIGILRQQVEESKGNMDEDAAVATTGKRSHDETEEQSPRPKKRQKCCPLCLSTSHLTSEKNVSGGARGAATSTRSATTCSVCEDDGICFKCHSKCLKCIKPICADCFATCSKCNSSAYCSDCVDSGNGNCASCFKLEQLATIRAEKRAEKRAQKRAEKSVLEELVQKSKIRSEKGAEKRVEMIKRVDKMAEKNKPLPSVSNQSNRDDTHKSTQITVRAADEPLPSVANQSNRDDTQIPTLFVSPEFKPPESYAQHRFYISGDIEKIGCCIRGPVDGKITLVQIEENSLAALLGIREGDELYVPGVPSVAMREYFIDAIRSPHPMIFHVLRSCPKPRNDSTLHRFVVHEPGKLGVRIKKMNDTTYISCVDRGSLAERHGICIGDVMCKPFTNGSEISGLYDWFYLKATSSIRPFTFEVFRKKSVIPTPCKYSFGDENPFIYRIPAGSSSSEKANNEKSNHASSIPPLVN